MRIRKGDPTTLDAPRWSERDLAKRWRVHEDTVKRWIKAGRLGKPHFFSPTCKRFTERQVRDFEKSLPRDYDGALKQSEQTA